MRFPVKSGVRVFLAVQSGIDLALSVGLLAYVGSGSRPGGYWFSVVSPFVVLLVVLSILSAECSIAVDTPGSERLAIGAVSIIDCAAGGLLLIIGIPELGGSLSSEPLIPLAYTFPIVVPLLPGGFLMAAGILGLLVRWRWPPTARPLQWSSESDQ
jgi:hypothetical protein